MVKVIHKSRKRLGRLLTSLLVVALLLLGGFGWWHFNHASGAKTPRPAKVATVIHYAPATKQEQAESDQNKDQIVADQNAPKQSTPSGQLAAVTPFISYSGPGSASGSEEVDAYVNGVTEDGGTCTLTLSLGSHTLTKTSSGFMNASTTNCQNFTIARSEFPVAGNWSAVVGYSSSTSAGTSSAASLEVK